MKLLDIFRESRPGRKRTTLLYHGTSSKYLDSIKKHGLLPNTDNQGYGNEMGQGYESYGGVYLTSNYHVARQAASDTSDFVGGVPIIIRVQYVLGSGGADEDYITHTLIHVYKNSDEIRDFMDFVKNSYIFNAVPLRDIKLFYDLYQAMNDVKDEKFLSNPEFRRIIKKIIEKIKIYKLSSWENVRINRPIGFKGKTRILSIQKI